MTGFGPHKITVAETPSFGIDHLPSTDMQELWRLAGESLKAESEQPFDFSTIPDIDEDEEELLTLNESIDSLAEERITLKRSFTPEGLAVKAASNLFAKPFRRIVSQREEEVLKTRAAIVAESLRTGLTPKKTIKGSDRLLAAALGAKEQDKDDELSLPLDTQKLYEEILERHGLTPAESMKLAEGAFAGGERRGRKVATVAAALVAMLVLTNQVQDDGSDAVQAATTAANKVIATTTSTTISPTTTTVVQTTTTAAPATTVAPPTTTTVPPIIYSQIQRKLGKRYSFRLNAEPLEDAAKGLTAKLGEQWDVPTLQAYTGIEPGFVGTTAVIDCVDGANIILAGETLETFAKRNQTTPQAIKEKLPDGVPRMLAGLCLPK